VLHHSKQKKLHIHRINNKQNEKEIKIFILQGFYISLKKARHVLLVVTVRQSKIQYVQKIDTYTQEKIHTNDCPSSQHYLQQGLELTCFF
jgi:hypothetical protein